jgi:hypothetical protein
MFFPTARAGSLKTIAVTGTFIRIFFKNPCSGPKETLSSNFLIVLSRPVLIAVNRLSGTGFYAFALARDNHISRKEG